MLTFTRRVLRWTARLSPETTDRLNAGEEVTADLHGMRASLRRPRELLKGTANGSEVLFQRGGPA